MSISISGNGNFVASRDINVLVGQLQQCPDYSAASLFIQNQYTAALKDYKRVNWRVSMWSGLIVLPMAIAAIVGSAISSPGVLLLGLAPSLYFFYARNQEYQRLCQAERWIQTLNQVAENLTVLFMTQKALDATNTSF